MDTEVMNQRELANSLGLSTSTLSNWKSAGLFTPDIEIGRRLFYSSSVVDKIREYCKILEGHRMSIILTNSDDEIVSEKDTVILDVSKEENKERFIWYLSSRKAKGVSFRGDVFSPELTEFIKMFCAASFIVLEGVE